VSCTPKPVVRRDRDCLAPGSSCPRKRRNCGGKAKVDGHMRRLVSINYFSCARLACVALAVAGSLVVISATRTKITCASANEIRVGMTLHEVMAILGGPPRIEGERRRQYEPFTRNPIPTVYTSAGESVNEYTVRWWRSDEAVVIVWFSSDGVGYLTYSEYERTGLQNRCYALMRQLLE